MDPNDGEGQRSIGTLERIWLALLGLIGTVATVLATDVPADPARWTLLVVGALAIALGIAGSGPRRGGQRAGRRIRRFPRRRLLVGATVFAVTVAVGAAAITVAPQLVRAVRVHLHGCPHPTELRVLTSPTSLPPYRELADEYEKHTADANDGCPTANLFVYAAPVATVVDELNNGWPPETALRHWPRPDVWLADSRLDLAGVSDQPAGTPYRLSRPRHLASTPLVLAVPARELPNLAARLRSPVGTDGGYEELRTTVTWDELLRALDLSTGEEPVWDVLRPEPATSPLGRVATAAIYASAGVTGRAPTDTARQLERWFAASLDGGAYPADDVNAMLCAYRREATAGGRTAVVLTEQLMVAYNHGRLGVGPRCRPGGTAPPARDGTAGARPDGSTLVAFYPVDTLRFDRWVVRFDWSDTAGPQEEAAAAFEAWLSGRDGPAGPRQLLAAGLRSPAALGPPLTAGSGVVPGAAPGAAIEPAAVDTAVAAQAAADRPGRLLVLLDTSGSMTRAVDAARTRFDVAAEAVSAMLHRMTREDEFGLWTFPGPGDDPVHELLPVQALDDLEELRARTRADLRDVRVRGDTPLFRATAEGLAAVGPSEPDRIAALVVITDGDDTVGEVPLNLPDGTRVFVIAVGEASCANPVLTGVTGDSGGRCTTASFDTLDQTLGAVASAIWGRG